MKTSNLSESLREFGIRAADYKRAPVPKGVFALTMRPTHPEGVITVQHGNAEVEIHGDKRRRQAAVTVRERDRVVTKRVKAYAYGLEYAPGELGAENRLKMAFPVVMPNNVEWSVTDLEVKASAPPATQHFVITGIVTAIVKDETVNHFLIGMDETHHFISPLPEAAKSVEHAHRILRPSRMSKKAKRQGEWFFAPCSPTEVWTVVNKAVKRKNWNLGGTTHWADEACFVWGSIHGLNSRMYARGYITDRRTGRHKAMFLKGWHKVLHNNEVAVIQGPSSRLHRSAVTFD